MLRPEAIDTIQKGTKKTHDHHCFIACLPFIRRINHRLGSGRIVEEVGASDLLALKRAGIMNNTNGNKNREENKMKVLNDYYFEDHAYLTVLLAYFYLPLTSHHFFLNCHPSSPKDDRWAFLTALDLLGGGQGDFGQMEDSISWS